MGQCERMLRVDAPADHVWAWMSQPRNIFGVNLFHAEVDTDKTELQPGDVVDIDHNFFGVAQQARQAKVREIRQYYLAFGEYKKPESPGRDPFPHNQSFQVVPVDESSCIVVNRLSGRYVFPGSGVLGERLFRRYIPVILDDDNQMIAVGCGAMEPTKLKVPKGLFLWPAMIFSTRFIKKSTRRQMLEKMKQERRDAREAAEPESTGASAAASGAEVEAGTAEAERTGTAV